MDSLRGTPLLVPMDKETLPVDVEAVKKAEEENKLIMENRLKVQGEEAAAAAGLNTKTTRSTNSKEKHTKAAAKKAAKAPTNANAGSILTDDALPGRSRSPNFFHQLTSQKSLNATMMQPPSPKGSIPPHQGFRATSSVTPPQKSRVSSKTSKVLASAVQTLLQQLATHARLSTRLAPRCHRCCRRCASIL